MKQKYVTILLFLLFLLFINPPLGQKTLQPSVFYTYDAAGNRVTAISTSGNNGSRSASSIVSPPSRQAVESAVTKSRKEDVSSGDDPQRIVGDIADERK